MQTKPLENNDMNTDLSGKKAFVTGADGFIGSHLVEKLVISCLSVKALVYYNSWNNYGWSKLGGESAVQMYKNSLIVRCALTEYPFKHKKAFSDVKSNFIYHKDFIHILLKIIDKRGTINVGGKSQTIFNFVRKEKKN